MLDNVINVIVIAVLVCIFVGVGLYIYKAKKRGDACIGCPYAKQCGSKCSGGCSHTENNHH